MLHTTVSHDADDARSLLQQGLHSLTLAQNDALIARQREQPRNDVATLGPSGVRIEVTVRVPARCPSRESSSKAPAVHPFDILPKRRHDLMAIVLEPTGPHLLPRQQQETGFVIERPARLGIPTAPRRNTVVGETGVKRICAIIGTDDFAHIGRGGLGVG